MPGRSMNRYRCAKPPRRARWTRIPRSNGAAAFLEARNYSKDQSLAGIAEVDEIFLLESFKGQRKLLRAARKCGGVAEKPGLSAEQIPILIARDRAGSHIDGALPDRSEAAVRPVLEGKLSKDDTLLCMDGDKALNAFAKAEGIEYELTVASKGEHVHEKVLAYPERRCLRQPVQAVAPPFQRRRNQVSAKLPGLAALAGKRAGSHSCRKRPRCGTLLKPARVRDRAGKLDSFKTAGSITRVWSWRQLFEYGWGEPLIRPPCGYLTSLESPSFCFSRASPGENRACGFRIREAAKSRILVINWSGRGDSNARP
jgi:hypothetical protein